MSSDRHAQPIFFMLKDKLTLFTVPLDNLCISVLNNLSVLSVIPLGSIMTEH